MIRDLKQSDIQVCAKKHLTSMERSLHTISGLKWMSHVYQGLIQSDHAFALVEENSDNELVGAVGGILNSTAFKNEIALEACKNAKILLFLTTCLMNPKIMIHQHFLESHTNSLLDSKAISYLAFIWLDSNQRSKGLGRNLMNAFVERVRSKHHSQFYLYCTGTNEANGFYLSLGCRKIGAYKGTNIYVSTV
jgi:ribosomal protein S18 acetylase RimI-like enzyme